MNVVLPVMCTCFSRGFITGSPVTALILILLHYETGDGLTDSTVYDCSLFVLRNHFYTLLTLRYATTICVFYHIGKTFFLYPYPLVQGVFDIFFTRIVERSIIGFYSLLGFRTVTYLFCLRRIHILLYDEPLLFLNCSLFTSLYLFRVFVRFVFFTSYVSGANVKRL